MDEEEKRRFTEKRIDYRMRAEHILDMGRKLMKLKGEDYTNDVISNQHENFERAAVIASWFIDEQDKVFAILIGIKLARLSSLLRPGKIPNNESVLDTFVDMCNYSALWGSKRTLLSPNKESILKDSDRYLRDLFIKVRQDSVNGNFNGEDWLELARKLHLE